MDKGIKQQQIIDFYIHKSVEELFEHTKHWIDRVIQIQYKGYLRDIEIISKIQKKLSDNYKKIDK